MLNASFFGLLPVGRRVPGLFEEFRVLRCILSSSSSYLAVTSHVSVYCSRSKGYWIPGKMTQSTETFGRMSRIVFLARQWIHGASVYGFGGAFCTCSTLRWTRILRLTRVLLSSAFTQNGEVRLADASVPASCAARTWKPGHYFFEFDEPGSAWCWTFFRCKLHHFSVSVQSDVESQWRRPQDSSQMLGHVYFLVVDLGLHELAVIVKETVKTRATTRRLP